MVIYSLKIAKELDKKGFKIIDIGLNFKQVGKKVFIFEDSNELISELEKNYNIKINK